MWMTLMSCCFSLALSLMFFDKIINLSQSDYSNNMKVSSS